MLDALETAGKAIGGLARHVEVAEFVDGLVGEELLSRRELIKTARVELEATQPDASPSPPPAPVPKETTGRHDRAEGWAPGEPRAGNDAVRRDDRRALKAIGYVAVAAATFTIGTAVLRRGSPRNEQNIGSRAPDSVSAAAPKAVTPAEPSASAEPLPSGMPGREATPKVDEASRDSTKPEVHPAAEPRPAAVRPSPRKEKPAPSSGVVPFSTANPYR